MDGRNGGLSLNLIKRLTVAAKQTHEPSAHFSATRQPNRERGSRRDYDERAFKMADDQRRWQEVTICFTAAQ